MKRSEINTIMSDALAFLRESKFLIPPFATWSSTDWKAKGPEALEIVTSQLGWDITDFGSGDFARIGLFIFTIRNGTFAELRKVQGKTYAEKILIVREGQITPTHFHYQKMEDIINRGGGNLVIQLWNSHTDKSLADSPVTVSMDGVRVTVPAGGTVTLRPGDSVCLPQHLFHKFWGEPGGGTVLVGEVSRVNDDRVDNYFHEPVGRFPVVEEDVPPLHLLTMDYPVHCPHLCPSF
ncbi:MAG TPA: D-lyxose/D-mannose family sugar isomerase [Rariglobus sp.]|nr:D-lyxose/D-mannose family sugar isomerase [Rariglobus sp.]